MMGMGEYIVIISNEPLSLSFVNTFLLGLGKPSNHVRQYFVTYRDRW